MESRTRREFITGACAFAGLLAIGGGAQAFAADDELLRPPGGQDQASFRALCVKCDRCRSACPRGCVVTASVADSLLDARTPKLDFHRGYCDFCGKCIAACPTGALGAVGAFDPSRDKIGVAVLDRAMVPRAIVVLVIALIVAALFGRIFCLICPVGLTIALVIAGYQAVFQQSPTISLLVFALILLVEIVFFRKWCHRLCPMGALMSLVGSKAPLAKPRVDGHACLRSKGADCKVCVEACPELLDPHVDSIPECTRCGVCADKCPASAISLRLKSFEKEPEASSNSQA